VIGDNEKKYLYQFGESLNKGAAVRQVYSECEQELPKIWLKTQNVLF